jgi:hypothetical protein
MAASVAAPIWAILARPSNARRIALDPKEKAPLGKVLEAAAFVDDPGVFTTPWTAFQRYRRVEQGPLGEEVCAENNAGFFNYYVEPIPHAEKPDF